MKKKLIAFLSITALSISMLSTTAFASTSSAWSVNYSAGVPQSVANPLAVRHVAWSTQGYYSTCSSISGSNDRRVSVTVTNAGGLAGGTKYITTTGKSATWKTNNAINGEVYFRFVATGTSSCSAKGTLYRK